MKTLSNIRYILFALLILGSFANFAQNDYGQKMVDFCNFFLGLTYLVSVVWYLKEGWKEKKSSIIFSALTLFCFILIIVDILSGDPDNGIIPLEAVMFAILGIVVVESILVMVFNGKNTEPSNRYKAFESLGFFLILSGYFFRTMHWFGGSPLIICGSAALLFIYLYQFIRSFVKERKNGKFAALFSTVFFLNIALASIAYTFKTLHWPYGAIICVAATFFLILVLIPVLLNSKFSYLTEKISARKYAQRVGAVTLFIFVYVNYFTVFITLQNIGIGPRYYSLSRPPAYQKLVDDNKGDESPEAWAYIDNYNNFLQHRSDAENK